MNQIKLSAAVCLYDDFQFLPLVIDSIYAASDQILLLKNSKPWRGSGRNNDAEVIPILKDICAKYPKCQLILGTWDDEAAQRNAGLKIAKETGHLYQLIVDSDELFNPPELWTLKNTLNQTKNAVAFHCSFYTYFKDLHRIDPPEAMLALICCHTSKFLFYDKRAGLTADEYGIPTQTYLSAYIPPHSLTMYHLSYARSDEFIKNKLSNFSHSHEILDGWYENIWLKWTPEMKNIHPVNPSQYKKAIKQNLYELPPTVRQYFQQILQSK